MSPLILDHDNTTSLTRKRTKHFTVVPAKVPDVRRLVDIEFHAFENERANQVLSYRDYKKPAHFERSVNIYTAAIIGAETASSAYAVVPVQAQKRRHSGSQVPVPEKAKLTTNFRKVVDTESGEIVSFTKYEMKKYSEEELRSPADVGHEGEARMNREWFALNERLRREYIGTAEHCYIGMLATAPAHQHKGAGTMLLLEILAEADDAGVPVYLEATDTAKPLYERHGFEAITELRFEPAAYGVKGLGRERQTVMVRGRLGVDGVMRKVGE